MQNTDMRSDSPFYSTDSVTGAAVAAVSLRAVICGALVAVVVSIVLAILGSGFGLAFMSPYAGDEGSIGGFTAKMAIWLIIMQWASAGLGGYIAGRLRTKWTGLHSDESFFRDTAHGFLAWTFATILVAVLVAGTGASVASGAAKAATTVAAASAAGAGQAAASDKAGMPNIDYNIGSLFRGNNATTEAGRAYRNEANTIFTHGMSGDGVSAEDRAYLISTVSREAGVSQEEAATRVDRTIAEVTALKNEAVETADKARKAASAFSIFTAISMMIGAFVASVAAAAGGCHRDNVTICCTKKTA